MTGTPRQRRVVVAGATGYLGGYVVRVLHEAGWAVRALARDQGRLQGLEPFCSEVFVAEATRKETLVGLFQDADAAFSSIGVRHFHRRPTYEEVDYQANLNLMEAAAAAGVRRFAFISLLDGQKLRTLSPLIDAREQVVDRLRETDMETVILRPTGFFNDMGDIFRMARRGRVWLIGSGHTRINPIHGADLADVVARELAAPQTAENDVAVGGPEIYSQREIAELAFEMLGRIPRCSHLSPRLMRIAARAVRPVNKNASALALMFSVLGERDAMAPPFGTHTLVEYFRGLAETLGR